MKRKNKKFLLLFTGVLVVTLSNCRFKREIAFSLPAETYEQNNFEKKTDSEQDSSIYLSSIKLKKTDIDLDQFAQVFLGVPTIKDAEEYKPKHYFGEYYYEKSGTEVNYAPFFSISYQDENDGMASAYSPLIDPFFYTRISLGSSLRRLYPEEELDFCTKEQAIKACKKYADICGYENAEVSSYGITLDAIEKIMIKQQRSFSAPGEGYEIITRGEVEALRDEGKEKEAEALDEKRYSANERNLPWKKEHEAILLIYRLKLNDILVDDRDQMLRIIYVPYEDKIAILDGYIPYEQDAVSENCELIRKEKAVSQAAQALGIRTQEDMDINSISLIYTIEFDTDNSCYAVPAWKIDYCLKNTSEYDAITDPGTICIDAISGFVVDS